MAAYRFSAKVISRSSGRSATAAAAYRAAELIADERTGLVHDYARKAGVVHAEILAPDDAPDWMRDRAALWNAVEAAEKRKDAQLARELQLNLPHELDDDTRRELARSYIEQEFVARGMIADLAIHAPDRQSDRRNHHAHVMLTMRCLTGDGFGKKERDWNDRDLLENWREQWATYQNRALEAAGLDIRVDHRTLEAQGIDREPEPKLGPQATQMEREGRESHAGNDLRAVWARNAEREALAEARTLSDLEIAQQALEGAQMAREGLQADAGASAARKAFVASERAAMAEEMQRYQDQVDQLAAQLDGRSRVAVFWDKLRGRLGWRAEMELETARTALEDVQHRRAELEADNAAAEFDERARPPAEPERDIQPEFARATEPEPPERSVEDSATLKEDFAREAAGRSPEAGELTAEEYAQMFLEAYEAGQDMDREIE